MTPKRSDTARHAPSRSEEIAAILRDEILSGQYRSGERLPSERDLSARFDSSRGAVREALKRLEQLGIASVQPGGARVVPVEECTLGVLGPLLDLNDVPDPKLVDEALHLFGALVDVAARSALEKATDAEIERAQEIVDDIISYESGEFRQHDALRRLAGFFIDVADHLVLRLTINGLRMSFFGRMQTAGIQPRLDNDAMRRIAGQLRNALARRDAAQVGSAMKGLNRLFRDSAREALNAATATPTRNSA